MYVCVYIWIWVTAHPPTQKINTNTKPNHTNKPPTQIKQSAPQVFQKGLQEDPYHCPLYQAFGMLLADLGRVDAARYV